MKKILSVVLACLLLFTGVLTGYAEEEEKKILRVAVCAEYFPFEYVEDGELKGFDIDLMTYIGALAGFEIEFQNAEFAELRSLVKRFDADCAISAMTITADRAESTDVTEPYIICNQRYIDGTREEKTDAYGIYMRKGDSRLSVVNNAVRTAILDGTVEQLVEKYGLDNADSYAEYDYELTPILPEPPSVWAQDSIHDAKELGIAEYESIYSYQKPITREEFCTAVAKLVRSVCEGSELLGELNSTFKDTKNPDITLLNRLGIIHGKSETEFAPADTLTREEAATILVRMINLLHPVPATELWFEFEDGKEISDWASDAVQTICNMGVMAGIGDNKFAPQDSYTVEQAFATIVRAYDAMKEAGIPEGWLEISWRDDKPGALGVSVIAGYGPNFYNDVDGQARIESRKEWFNAILACMTDEDEQDPDVVEEYRIVDSMSFLGIEYVEIKVFSDRTGTLCLKGYNDEVFYADDSEDGEMVYDETVSLTAEQVETLLAIFEENHFWDIPPIHPEEELGLDGNTVFIEGKQGDKYHFISMWSPEKQYELSKIHAAVLEFAEAEGLSLKYVEQW